MDAEQQIWVRMCKSKEPRRMLNRWHNRLYLFESEAQRRINISENLLEIIRSYIGLNVSKMIAEVEKEGVRCSLDGESFNDAYQEALVRYFVSVIRFAKASDIYTYKTPLKWRS